VVISSRRSIANLKVSSMNWALLPGQQDLNRSGCLYSVLTASTPQDDKNR
jgi:hypothetical protein